MKVYWWQGGLHFEPEGKEDTDALMRLWSAERVTPASTNGGCSVRSGSPLVEHIKDGLVRSS
jgi:hypothetical protein